MRTRLRVATAIVVAGIGVWALVALWRDGGDVETAAVTTRDLDQVIETTGVVEPVELTVASGAVPGRVALVAVRPGDRVERYDIVAQLDRRPYETIVDEATRVLEAAELSLTAIEVDGSSDEPGAVMEVIVASSAVEAARAALAAAERDLGATTILAPTAGTVLTVDAAAGGPYEAGAPVATIQAGDRLRVAARLDQIDLPRVPVGTAVRVVVDAFPATELNGWIEDVAPEAVTEGGGALFPAAIAVPNLATIDARPGMTATVIVPAVEARDALVVPEQAIRTVGRRSFLTVLRDGEGVRVEVGTGMRADGLVEITAGDVGEGERVRIGE